MKSVEMIRDAMQSAAARSDDPHTQIGCVITSPRGDILVNTANSLTNGVRPSPELLERPEKYDWIEHAERNAIFVAAKYGCALEGAHMHIPGFPCVECARAIVQSGISELHCGAPHTDDPRYKFEKARTILAAASVKIVEY